VVRLHVHGGNVGLDCSSINVSLRLIHGAIVELDECLLWEAVTTYQYAVYTCSAISSRLSID